MNDTKHRGYGYAPDLAAIAPRGHYIALRIGYAFPLEEINNLPADWVAVYTAERYMLRDPVLRWAFNKTGAIRWSDIDDSEGADVMQAAHDAGLRYGLVVSCLAGDGSSQRSFGSFAREDREFTDDEVEVLSDYMANLHANSAPPSNVTAAEREALLMVREGKRLKQIAHELGVTEGAVKQRLKNAKTKLGAATNAQAAAKAGTFGLL